ncbi:MAG: hypothetical protein U5L45_01950 [Saprospiraceae bacterium]|nr:hypothetical protein [Saprospiraceae bacterium]
MVHFSGKARKMNHIPLSRERSERENYSSLDFMYGFKTYVTKKRLWCKPKSLCVKADTDQLSYF